jgi:hypothetical protein
MKETVDDLWAEQERADAVAHVLERHLDTLDPRSAPWNRRLGIEMPDTRDYPLDELGSAHFRRDLAVRRMEWLKSRYDELSMQADRREEATRARRRGISRFLPDGMSLDHLIALTAENPDALNELRLERFEERQAARERAIEAAA